MDFELSRGPGRAAGRRAQLLRWALPDRAWCASWPSVGGVDRARWRELAELGLFSLRLPEADGGAELGWTDAVLAFEELGPSPGAGAAGVDPPAGRPGRRRGHGRGRRRRGRARRSQRSGRARRRRSTCWPCSTTTGCGWSSRPASSSSRCPTPLDPLTPGGAPDRAAAPGRAPARRRRRRRRCASAVRP